MADLLVAWVASPALLLAVFTATGLGVRRLAGDALPLTLVPACGLASAVAVGGILAGTAHELIVPALLGLAVAGAVAGRAAIATPGAAAVAAVAATLALYAAPIVLSGEATFAGYIKLDDTATWLALTDRIMDAGTSTDGLGPSTYEAVLAINFGNGYPVGGFVPLGFASAILRIDPAWLIQPYIAVTASVLALALFELARAAVATPRLRATVAVAAACPALLVGFYLWGGVKELMVASLVPTMVAVAAASRTGGPRGVVPIGALLAGLVAGAGLAGLVWAAPALALVAWTQIGGARLPLPVLAGGAGAASLVVLLVVLSGADLSPLRGSFTNQSDLGNLASPLEPAQLAGIWPASDFRFDPGAEWATSALVALVLFAAAAGALAAIRRGDVGLGAYALGAPAVCGAVAVFASPWLDAKALAIASPAVLLAALVALARARCAAPALGALGLAVLTAGIAWSLVAQWGGANLAPRAQLVELERLGERLAGGGPTLMTEYQPYGVRHFLRDAEPEGASELRRRGVPLLPGGTAAKGEWVDTDELAPAALEPYAALVLRRTPEQSRPPGAFERTWAGEFYELWERDSGAPSPIARLPLGEGRSPVAVPACAEVRSLAARAGPDGRLTAARAPDLEAVLRGGGGEWIASGPDVDVWVAGSVRGEATLTVDGQRLASRRHLLNNEGLYVGFGSIATTAGRHELALEVAGADLHPGSAPDGSSLGRMVLRREPPADAIHVVPAADARNLCGNSWDWIEAF